MGIWQPVGHLLHQRRRLAGLAQGLQRLAPEAGQLDPGQDGPGQIRTGGGRPLPGLGSLGAVLGGRGRLTQIQMRAGPLGQGPGPEFVSRRSRRRQGQGPVQLFPSQAMLRGTPAHSPTQRVQTGLPQGGRRIGQQLQPVLADLQDHRAASCRLFFSQPAQKLCFHARGLGQTGAQLGVTRCQGPSGQAATRHALTGTGPAGFLEERFRPQGQTTGGLGGFGREQLSQLGRQGRRSRFDGTVFPEHDQAHHASRGSHGIPTTQRGVCQDLQGKRFSRLAQDHQRRQVMAGPGLGGQSLQEKRHPLRSGPRSRPLGAFNQAFEALRPQGWGILPPSRSPPGKEAALKSRINRKWHQVAR